MTGTIHEKCGAKSSPTLRHCSRPNRLCGALPTRRHARAFGHLRRAAPCTEGRLPQVRVSGEHADEAPCCRPSFLNKNVLVLMQRIATQPASERSVATGSLQQSLVPTPTGGLLPP